jgi:hypothetical protein
LFNNNNIIKLYTYTKKGEIYMRNIVKVSLLILFALFSSGCFEKEDYNIDLAKVFPQIIGETYIYDGYAEYNHSIILKNVINKKVRLINYFEGNINDARGGIYANRPFNITYIIDKDSIRELIVNKDKYRTNLTNNRLHSIVPNQIILKLPLEINNRWEQQFVYNNKNYVAEIEIIEVTLSKENNKQYVTRLTVNGIPGYINEKYIEEKVYVEGKGLINFSNSILDSDEMFSYYQTIIN